MNFYDNILGLMSSLVTLKKNDDDWFDFSERVAHFFDLKMFAFYKYQFGENSSPKFFCSKAFKIQDEATRKLLFEYPGEKELELHKAVAVSRPTVFHTENEHLGDHSPSAFDGNWFREKTLGVTGAASRGGARLNDIGPFVDVAAIHFPYGASEVTPALRASLNLVFSVLAKTIENERVIASLARRYQKMLAAFDKLDFGVAFVDDDGKRVVANQCFVDLCKDGDAICLSGDMVCGKDSKATQQIRDVLSASKDLKAHPSKLITSLPRRSLRTPLILKCCRLNEGGIATDDVNMLLCIDPTNDARLSARGLSALGVLSDAELEVCQLLLRGAATEEIAERRSTSVNTVRDQIKSSSSKLACTSRLEITRLAMASNPPVKED